MGYSMASFISPQATILNGGVIGDNCFILEDNTVQPYARIGSNVTLWSGNHIGHHSVIGDHTFIASHVVVSGGVEIGERCFVGVNATLRDHIEGGDLSRYWRGRTAVGGRCRGRRLRGVALTERSRVPSSRLRKI